MALKLRSKVQFPASVVGSGGIMVSKANGAWTVEPDFSALATVVASAISDATTKQIWIFDPLTGEYNVLTLAGLGDALYKTTSATSLAIGTGSKTFVIQSGKDIIAGDWVLATSDSGPTNFMLGQVTSYSGTSLVVNVTVTGGSGTKTDWTIRLSAPSSGRSSGFSYKWSTDTTASDPTAGFVKANNATFASITTLYLSETDADANALAAEFATWSSSTSSVKGRIKIYDPVTPTNFMTFDLTAFTDSGAYDTLTVTPIANGGSFSASLALRVSFSPKGDKGDTGATGATSVTGTPSAGQMAKFASSSSIQAATAGTDYLAPPSGTALLKANSGGALANAVAGTDYQAADSALHSNIPVNSKSAAYTTVLSDANSGIYHPSSDNNARTYTIDSNANVAYPVGTTLTFFNEINTVTIAITSDTLILANSGATGSRTLAANGLATAWKVATTKWVISGSGLS